MNTSYIFISFWGTKYLKKKFQTLNMSLFTFWLEPGISRIGDIKPASFRNRLLKKVAVFCCFFFKTITNISQNVLLYMVQLQINSTFDLIIFIQELLFNTSCTKQEKRYTNDYWVWTGEQEHPRGSTHEWIINSNWEMCGSMNASWRENICILPLWMNKVIL